MPEVPSGHTFKADLLQGVKFPASILDASDAYAIRMGFNGNRRGRGRGRGRGGAAQRFIQYVRAPHLNRAVIDHSACQGTGWVQDEAIRTDDKTLMIGAVLSPTTSGLDMIIVIHRVQIRHIWVRAKYELWVLDAQAHHVSRRRWLWQLFQRWTISVEWQPSIGK